MLRFKDPKPKKRHYTVKVTRIRNEGQRPRYKIESIDKAWSLQEGTEMLSKFSEQELWCSEKVRILYIRIKAPRQSQMMRKGTRVLMSSLPGAGVLLIASCLKSDSSWDLNQC